MPINDDQLLTIDQRIMKQVGAFERVHASAAQARHIIAISGMESAYMTLIAPKTAWGIQWASCGVTVVGPEWGAHVSPVAWRDPQTRSYLLANKMVTSPDPKQPDTMLWAPKVRGMAVLSKRLYAMVEDTIRFHLRGMVNHFSFGPSQLYLAYAGKELGGSGGVQPRPQTWKDLVTWYMRSSDDDWALRRLVQVKTLPASGSDADRIAWLRTYQVGFAPNRAESYYYGTGPWSGTGGFQGKLNKVSSFI